MHEARLAHPSSHHSPHQPKRATSRCGPPKLQTKHSTTAQPSQPHTHYPPPKSTKHTRCTKNRTQPKATLATPLPKPKTATGVSREFLKVPSPTCTKHLVSTNNISPRTHNPLATQQAQLLGHFDCIPNKRPPHCLEQHKNDTVNHA